jgi:hypothetical protein
MQRLQVTSSPIACWMSPVSLGSSSSPVPASPSTKGLRRKLVTSSLEIVRAVLKVAAERTARSSAL